MDTNPLPMIGLALIFAVGGRVVDRKPASSNLFFHRGVDTMPLQVLSQECKGTHIMHRQSGPSGYDCIQSELLLEFIQSILARSSG
jgi:hypothetical protein